MKILLTLLCALCLLGTAPLSAASLSFETSAVVASGFTPGRQVVLYGCANPPQAFSRRVRSYLQVFTADSSGGARWDFADPIETTAVWFAIGSVPGQQVVAVPGLSGAPAATLPPPPLLVSSPSDAISLGLYLADVLVVGADDEVWFGSAIRHGDGDLNRGLPGTLSYLTSSMASMGASGSNTNAPTGGFNHVRATDVAVVVDPVSLSFYIGHLTAN